MNTLFKNFLLSFLPILLGVFVIIFSVSQYIFYQKEIEQLDNKLDWILASQSLMITEAVWKKDLSKVQLQLATVISDPEIVFIHIKDNKNNTLDKYGENDINNQFIVKSMPLTYVHNNQLVKVGELEIAVSQVKLMDKLKYSSINLIFILSTLLLLTIISSYFSYLKIFKKAMTSLSDAFNHSRSGVASLIDWHNENDDIGRMLKAYNAMQERQIQYEKEIIDNKDTLSQQVMERTQELTAQINLTKQAQQQISKEKELFLTTLESINESVISVDTAGYINYVNSAGCQLLAIDEAYSTLQIGQILTLFAEESNRPLVFLHEQAKFIGHEITEENNFARLINRVGDTYLVRYQSASLSDTHTGSVIVLSDETKQRMLNKEIAFYASHDSLTGLLNRRQFEISVEEALQSKNSHCIAFIDLDEFKAVNDTLGHLAGDELLKNVSKLMIANLRESDVLARIGGDEFAILFVNCPIDIAEKKCTLIINAINNYRHYRNEKTVNIGSSIGLYEFNSSDNAVNDVLSRVDKACYTAKRNGGRKISIFNTDDSATFYERRLS